MEIQAVMVIYLLYPQQSGKNIVVAPILVWKNVKHCVQDLSSWSTENLDVWDQPSILKINLEKVTPL